MISDVQIAGHGNRVGTGRPEIMDFFCPRFLSLLVGRHSKPAHSDFFMPIAIGRDNGKWDFILLGSGLSPELIRPAEPAVPAPTDDD